MIVLHSSSMTDPKHSATDPKHETVLATDRANGTYETA